VVKVLLRYLNRLLKQGVINERTYAKILRDYPSKYGASKTKQLVERGVRQNRLKIKHDNPDLEVRHGMPQTYTSDKVLKHFKGRDSVYGRAASTSSQDIGFNDARIPEILHKWKKKDLSSYIDIKYGDYNPAKIMFYEPKLGTQLIVDKAKHLKKLPSGGFGNRTIEVPIKGKMTKVRGPWSSRAGIVRRAGVKDFRGWDELPMKERVKRLREYEEEMSLLDMALKSNLGKS